MSNRLPTLDEFMKKTNLPNSDIFYKGFSTLYVRKGPRYINGLKLDNVLDIARVEAAIPGIGSFTKLVRHINVSYPLYTIYIENVLNPRFIKKLVTLGFVNVLNSDPPCFVKTLELRYGVDL